MVEDQFGRLVESMFEDFFAPLAQGALPARDDASMPRLDVSETEQNLRSDRPKCRASRRKT
jgi:HSP20 family protein